MRATLLKTLLSISLLAGSASAYAADPASGADAVRLPSFPPLPAAVAVQNAGNDWSGVYVGGFGNYTTGSFDSTLGRVDASGYEGGVFAGYDYAIDNYIIGGEADIALGSVAGEDGATDTNLEKRINGSVRARAGVAVDRVLIYGTAGLAIAGTEIMQSSDADTATHLGWTVGAGVDVKITEKLFGRIEYRYTDYDSKTFSLGSEAVASGFDEHSVRAGLGIKF
ncbi:MAG: outer membrane protein [Pseudomonadota bacterium]